MRRFLFPALLSADLFAPSAGGTVVAFFATSRAAVAAVAANRVVPCNVLCTMVDRDNCPVGNAEMRLGLSRGASVGSGLTLHTDGQGNAAGQTELALRSGVIKRPTNFVDSWFSGKEATDEFEVTAEFDYLGRRWQYVFPVHRLVRDGAMLYSGVRVYAPDAQGNYTREVLRDATDGWAFPDLDGAVLSDSGYALDGCSLTPTTSATEPTAWTLVLRFKRSPEPVRR